ncbi:MAG: hypothetical protein PVG85_06485, partial [Deltaproteobacteria bacterium]
YKSGTLRGLKTRAGYIESRQGSPYYFVFFLKSQKVDIDALTGHLVRSLDQGLNRESERIPRSLTSTSSVESLRD